MIDDRLHPLNALAPTLVTDGSVILLMAVLMNAEAGMLVIEAGVLSLVLPVFTCLKLVHPCIDGIWLTMVLS